MRKSICLLVICMMLVLNTVAFASEMPVVSVKDGIEMSKISYDNLEDGKAVENTLLTITMSAKASEESEVPYAFVAVLYDADVMIGLDSDTKPIGTESTSFKAELNLPDDVSACRIAVALLKKTTEGFVPISKASYCPADSKFSKLVKVTADGKAVNFDSEFNALVSLAPTATDFPEVFEVQTAEASTTVDFEIDETFPGDATITATLPNGDNIVYTMTFVRSKHILSAALEEESYVDADEMSSFGNNKISKEDVLSSALFEGVEGKFSYGATFEDFYLKSFSNLSGVNEENHYGSRWTTDFDSSQVHAIHYVHPSLEGYDYFITKNGELESNPGFAMFEFDISYDAKIVILATNKCKDYPLDGWTEGYNSDGFIRANDLSYKNSSFMDEIGYTISYNEAKAWDKNVDSMQFYSTAAGGNEAYNNACSSLASSLSRRYGRLVTKEDLYGLKGKLIYDEYAYSYAYSKEFELEEGEESKTVTIYGPDTNQKKGLVVVVVPKTPEKAEVPYEEALLKAIEIDGWPIADFKEDEYVYEYKIDPRTGLVPEIKGIPQGSGLTASTEYSIAEDGKSATATITVADALNPSDASNTYKVEMVLDEYKPNFVSSDYDIVEIGDAAWVNRNTVGYNNYGENINNQTTNAAVVTEYDKGLINGTLWNNLNGVLEKGDPVVTGSQWTPSFAAGNGNAQRFIVYALDDSIKGSQYFPFLWGNSMHPTGDYMVKFNVKKPCKVSIIQTSEGALYEGFTQKKIPNLIKATYSTSGITKDIYSADADDLYTANADVSFGMLWDMTPKSVNPDTLTWDEYYKKYYKYNGAKKSSDELKDYFNNIGYFKETDGTNAVATGTYASFGVCYEATFKAGSEVVIPKDSNKVSYNYTRFIVITPYEEIADKITQ